MKGVEKGRKMPIPIEDLALHPHLTGKQILELFFGEAAKYRGKYVLSEHCQTAQVADDFINWVTNAIKAKELELYYHSSSAKSSLDSIRINYGMGSIYWFERCEFDRDELFYWINDKKIISKFQSRGIKIEEDLIEAMGKSSTEPIEEKQKNSLPEKEGFPPHQLNNWEQINFCALTEKACLEVGVDGESFSETELTDRKFSKKNLSFLYNIVLKDGFFDKDSFPNNKNVSQSINRLNISLRKIFKINKDPISYNQDAKGYKTAFETEIDPSS
jgi:hypothetical protein